MTNTQNEPVEVTQADREAAEEWAFIECRRCSEYEGDFPADLAADFARHRIASRATDTALAEELRALKPHLPEFGFDRFVNVPEPLFARILAVLEGKRA